MKVKKNLDFIDYRCYGETAPVSVLNGERDVMGRASDEGVRHGKQEVRAMNWVTLVVWLLTAIGGFTLLGVWLQHGGMDTAATRYFPKGLPYLHALAAVISLILFVIYLFADVDALKPVVLIGLLITAALGFWMFTRWLGKRRQMMARAVGADVAHAPEDHFPNVVVALHGVGAVATLVLYILAVYILAR